MATGVYEAWTRASPFNPSICTVLRCADKLTAPWIDANRTEPAEELIWRFPLTCCALIVEPGPSIARDDDLITSIVESPDLIIEFSARFAAFILLDPPSTLPVPFTSLKPPYPFL